MLVKERSMLSMPYANARVRIYADGDFGETFKVYLQSYETDVLELNVWADHSYSLYCTGLYSQTTIRHIGRFTSEFFGENLYHECKKREYTPLCDWHFVLNGCKSSVYRNIMDNLNRYVNV